jgi:hypothetical protein
MAVSNRMATPVGGSVATTPEAALISAALMESMRWVHIERTPYRGEHWMYLDQSDRIVAIIVGEEAIFSPVYEQDIPLGQYTTLTGAKWVVERWHAEKLKTSSTNGTYDAFEQAKSVVEFHELRKRAIKAKEQPEEHDEDDKD